MKGCISRGRVSSTLRRHAGQQVECRRTLGLLHTFVSSASLLAESGACLAGFHFHAKLTRHSRQVCDYHCREPHIRPIEHVKDAPALVHRERRRRRRRQRCEPRGLQATSTHRGWLLKRHYDRGWLLKRDTEQRRLFCCAHGAEDTAVFHHGSRICPQWIHSHIGLHVNVVISACSDLEKQVAARLDATDCIPQVWQKLCMREMLDRTRDREGHCRC